MGSKGLWTILLSTPYVISRYNDALYLELSPASESVTTTFDVVGARVVVTTLGVGNGGFAAKYMIVT